MTAVLPSASPRPALAPLVRRAALLLGVLPNALAILAITLGPSWFVADGLASVMDLVDRTGWGLDADRVESLANVAMFVPLGVSLGLAVRPRSWPLVALAGPALSAAVELAQTHLPGRVPDVHDLVANTSGGLLGLAIAVVLVGIAHLLGGARSGGGSRAVRVAAVLVLVVVLAATAVVAVRGASTGGSALGAPPAAAPEDVLPAGHADRVLERGAVSPSAHDASAR